MLGVEKDDREERNKEEKGREIGWVERRQISLIFLYT